MVDYQKYFNNYLDLKDERGEYRYFLDIDKKAASFPTFFFEDKDGAQKQAVNWCSNDYLAMGTHPLAIQVFRDSIKLTGTGSGGTRNIAGTTNHHSQLEQRIAVLHKKERALLFNSAYLANYTTLSSLGKLIPDLLILSDEENHASIIEGIRNAKSEKKIFNHNDVKHLEELLKKAPIDRPKLIVFESIYSMSGSIAPLNEIIILAKQYNALTYIDEVHAVGIYGPNYAGKLDEHDLSDKVDIINGTLAKSFGVLGGYIAAKKEITEAIRLKGAGFIFTTSLPPSICKTVLESINYITTHEDLNIAFHKNVNLLRTRLAENGIEFLLSCTHITPIIIGDSKRCKAITDELLATHGIYIQPINFPTVPKGTERLRITITPKHTEKDIVHLATSLKTVLKR